MFRTLCAKHGLSQAVFFTIMLEPTDSFVQYQSTQWCQKRFQLYHTKIEYERFSFNITMVQ